MQATDNNHSNIHWAVMYNGFSMYYYMMLHHLVNRHFHSQDWTGMIDGCGQGPLTALIPDHWQSLSSWFSNDVSIEISLENQEERDCQWSGINASLNHRTEQCIMEMYY